MTNGVDYSEVEQALRVINKSMVDLYRYVGYSRQSSSGYAKNGYIPKKFFPQIAQFFNVTIDDLYSNNLVNSVKSVRGVSIFEIQTNENTIPIPLSYTGAGAEAVIDTQLIETIDIEKKLLSDMALKSIDENTIAFKVIGDSMEPSYSENDIVFTEMLNGRNARLGDGVWLVRVADKVQIKQIQFTNYGHANIISLNSTYPIINTEKEQTDWEIIGKPFMRWGVQYFGGLEIDD